ncbi:DUF4214 domain-containing protein [Massilia sp. SR12]
MSDDYSANPDTHGVLTIGMPMTGWIESASDEDWIAVTLEANTTYEFSLTSAVLGGWPGHWDAPRLSMYDPTINQLFEKYDIGRYGYDPKIWIKPMVAGTYFLQVDGAKTGQYLIASSILARDDVGGKVESAKPIQLDQQVAGNLELWVDSDMFKIELQAGVTYTFAANGDLSQGNAAEPDASIYFMRDFGRLDRVSDYNFLGDVVNYTPWVSGTYYVVIKDKDIHAGSGNYTMRVQAAQDDFSANKDTTGNIAVGASVSGHTELNKDRDWLKFSATAGAPYSFSMQGADIAGNLTIYDSSGKMLQRDSSYDRQSFLQWTAEATGDFYIEVQNSSAPGPWTLNMAATPVDDYSANAATAGYLAANATLTGRLEKPNDVDWVKVRLEQGGAYTFSVTGAGGSYGGFKLVDAQGMEVPSVRFNHDKEALLSAQGLPTGDYYLAISDAQVAQADYKLSSSLTFADTIPGSAATTTTLLPGGVLRSAIDFSSDIDWVKVELAANRKYTIDLSGARTGGGTLGANGVTPELELLDSTGRQVVRSNYSHFDDPSLQFRPTADGTYYIRIGASGYGTAPATYTLKMGDEKTPIVDTQAPKIGTVNGPSSAKSALNDNLSLSFSEPVSLGSGTIVLSTANGTVLETFEIGGNPRVKMGEFGLLLDPTHALQYATDYVVTLSAGAVKDRAGLPIADGASGTFRTIDAPLEVYGTAGRDVFYSGNNSDFFAGRDGIDTVVFANKYEGYGFEKFDDVVHVTWKMGSYAHDTLTSVERVHFAEKTGMAFDINGNAGQAYRLYQAAFGRTPDHDGLGYWINTLDQGYSLQSAARSFINSDEFSSRFGAKTNDNEFLTALYKNVLGRAPDAEGLDYWTNTLNLGFGRDHVLAQFSESAENQAAVIGAIKKGFLFTIWD